MGPDSRELYPESRDSQENEQFQYTFIQNIWNTHVMASTTQGIEGRASGSKSCGPHLMGEEKVAGKHFRSWGEERLVRGGDWHMQIIYLKYQYLLLIYLNKLMYPVSQWKSSINES